MRPSRRIWYFHERYSLQFRWEMFNAFNTPSFGAPNATVPSNGGCLVLSTQDCANRLRQDYQRRCDSAPRHAGWPEIRILTLHPPSWVALAHPLATQDFFGRARFRGGRRARATQLARRQAMRLCRALEFSRRANFYASGSFDFRAMKKFKQAVLAAVCLTFLPAFAILAFGFQQNADTVVTIDAQRPIAPPEDWFLPSGRRLQIRKLPFRQ